MRTTAVLFVVAATLAASGVAVAADKCAFSAPRHAEIDAAGLQSLSVRIGPDKLDIRGQSGLTKVEVQGTACASRKEWLEGVQLQAGRQGNEASVVVHDARKTNIFSLLGSSYAYMKLDVRVPPELAVKLMQGSGEARASSLAALDATLGSGDLRIDGIRGELGLTVGSGDAIARDVGSLRVASVGSGDASIDGVHGNAHVGSVGSGDLRLQGVKGDVEVGSVGSGDAKLSNIGGAARVGSVGSGDALLANVTGTVSVASVSSGDIIVNDAGADVHVGSVGSGDLAVNNAGGDLVVDSLGSGDVGHRGVKGKVAIPRRDR